MADPPTRPKLVLDFDLRHPARLGATGPTTYAAALDVIEWADSVGFERVGFGEHHQSDDGYLPCPLVFAAAVGARTRRIRVRISILLAALYDPLRLAEEVAVADLCTQGRLDLAVGVGYVEADFDAFGRDFHRRGRALNELIPFLRRAWTGEPFEHEGTTVRVTPTPMQDPMPIFVGGGASRRSIERAVELGDGFFPPGMQQPWEAYRRLSVERGRPDPGEWAPRGPIFLWITTDDLDETWQRLAPHIRHQIDSYGEWTRTGHGRPTGPYVPTEDTESIRQGGAYRVVTPEEAVELAASLGPGGELHLNPLLAGIDPAEARRMLDLFERDVLPRIGTRDLGPLPAGS
jgi:alkanesulfonate monooxygenase SsuD/methylene tetrahydromethanopterin reductase-like flavin-dependent oxidoreductase (luciferase family)